MPQPLFSNPKPDNRLRNYRKLGHSHSSSRTTREKPSVGTRVDTFLWEEGFESIPAQSAVPLPRALLTPVVGTLGHDQSHAWA
eukprot:1450681-Rhodomonas_salina.2